MVQNVDSEYTELLIVEDLGKIRSGAEHLEGLVATGSVDRIDSFEEELIELTRSLLSVGVVDPDHSLVNIIVFSDGRLGRLDFELAECLRYPWLHTRLLGQMLGRLIVSYGFLMQPEVARTEAFARRLAQRVKAPRRALVWAERFIASRLLRQLERVGIDIRITPGW
jgi:hypothetical protein